MPGSPTTPGRSGTCVSAPDHVAFRGYDSVGARNISTFAAQWLACTLPYRRFADILADACARLGADVVRYTFIVMDLHLLLLAGLPAHRIIAFITEAPARHSVLCLGEPTTPPEVAPARGPPLWEQAAQPLAHWEDATAPVPSVSCSTSARAGSPPPLPRCSPSPSPGLTARFCRTGPKP